MKILNEYLELQNKIYAHFGYEEGWTAMPIDDRRRMWWELKRDTVRYHELREVIEAKSDDREYEDEICDTVHIRKPIMRAEGFAMICVDTRTDGNQFLAIYDNAKEIRIERADDDDDECDELPATEPKG